MSDRVEIRRAGPGDSATVARLLHDFNAEFEEETPAVEVLGGYARALLEAGEATALIARAAEGAAAEPAAAESERTAAAATEAGPGEAASGRGGPQLGSSEPAAVGIAVLRLRPGLWTAGAEAYLQELYVVPGRRGEGFGRALLEAAMEAAREAGATIIDLNTGETDREARGLYESAGFTNREGGPDGPAMLYYEREL